MNYTDNLRLLKPETNDLFDVAHANSNAELIDAAITAKASLEQVAAMLDQIIDTGQITDVDIGAVTTIREFIHNKGFRVGVGTQAEIEEQIAQGLAPEDSLMLPTNSPDIKDFERMKAATADTGWIRLTPNSRWSEVDNVYLKCRRIGKCVYISGRVQHDTGAGDENLDLVTLPEGFRPSTAGAYGLAYATPDVRSILPIMIYGSGLVRFCTPYSVTGGSVSIKGTVYQFAFSFFAQGED